MALMSTSLKVVSMAVVFFTETRRCANFLRRGVIFFLSSSRVPPSPFSPPKPLLMAFSTSALVMRPSFPVPFTFSILFSSISFFAEGEGTFLAYVSFFSSFLSVPSFDSFVIPGPFFSGEGPSSFLLTVFFFFFFFFSFRSFFRFFCYPGPFFFGRGAFLFFTHGFFFLFFRGGFLFTLHTIIHRAYHLAHFHRFAFFCHYFKATAILGIYRECGFIRIDLGKGFVFFNVVTVIF